MATFTETIRGDGLFRVHRALAAIVEEPQQLDDARARFDGPPPPYYSDRSGTTTRSQSPNPPTERNIRVRERRDRLIQQRNASVPKAQFQQQKSEETERILEADANGTHRLPVGSNYSNISYQNIKDRWIKQGLWSTKWTSMADGKWKHEEPLESESDQETDPDISSAFRPSTQSEAKRLKREDERRRIAERRAIREREREASRPYNQFIYQMSEERARIRNETGNGGDDYPNDINTRAYESVKSIWCDRNIWNEAWGIMPGMSWPHEKPWEESIAELGLQYDPVVREASTSVVNNAPHQPLYRLPVSGQSHYNPFVRDPSPAEVNGDHVSAIGIGVPQELQNSLDTSGDNNDNFELLTRIQTAAQVAPNISRLRATSRRMKGPDWRHTSHTRDRPQSPRSASLALLRQSEISNPPARRKSRRQLQSSPSKAVNDDQMPLQDQKVSKTVPQRRSARIRSAETDPDNKTNTHTSQVPRTKAVTRTVKLRNTVKPQGITKRRSPRGLINMAQKHKIENA